MKVTRRQMKPCEPPKVVVEQPKAEEKAEEKKADWVCKIKG